MEENTINQSKSKKKIIIIVVILVLVAGGAYSNYSKYGGFFNSTPNDAKLKSYCEEFIQEYYPQNSGIKFGMVYETEYNTHKVQVYIKTENILTVNEEVQFEFDKSGRIVDVYQMQEVSPFAERMQLLPYALNTFNSKHFD